MGNPSKAWCVAISVALWLLSGSAAAQGCPGARITTDDLLRVPVTVDGRPARLALDPIGRVLLDTQWARRNALDTVDSEAAGYGPEARIGGAGGEEQVPRFVLDPTVTVGEIEVAPPPAIVVDLRGPLGGSLADLDGLLGTELFTDHVLDLDLPNRCLVFTPRAGFAAPGLGVVPVERMRRRPVVDGEITLPDGETHRLALLLDFGMTGTLRISTRAVDALGLDEALDTRAPDRQDTGLGGTLQSLAATLPALRIGEATWSRLDIRLARETDGADADPPWDALIGVGLLRDRRVIYDAAGDRFWIEGTR
jgi:hypothetical protein